MGREQNGHLELPLYRGSSTNQRRHTLSGTNEIESTEPSTDAAKEQEVDPMEEALKEESEKNKHDPFFVSAHMHRFVHSGPSYTKKFPEPNGQKPPYEELVKYVTLYCMRCTATKEIIVEDRRAPNG